MPEHNKPATTPSNKDISFVKLHSEARRARSERDIDRMNGYSMALFDLNKITRDQRSIIHAALCVRHNELLNQE